VADQNSNAPAPDQAELAMNQVLQAERDAEQAVADCQMEAGKILQAAQVLANRIASRTDERITLLHMRCSQQVASEIRLLDSAERQASQAQEQSYRIDETGLADCIEEIAICLTGGMRVDADTGDAAE